MKSLRDRELIFTENHILETYSDGYVMMDWEDGIMKEHARAACHNQGDILEVGFGMGISAGYIQSFSPKSHTIMEFHPQVLEKLHKWAKDKEGVKIIEGDWIENLEEVRKKMIREILDQIRKRVGVLSIWPKNFCAVLRPCFNIIFYF